MTQKLRRKVGSRQPRMRGHCCKPVLLAPNQARSVPSPSSSGQETYCPLLLRRVVGGLRGGLGTPSNANNLRWVVITDKPSQVRRNQTDIGSLLSATQSFLFSSRVKALKHLIFILFTSKLAVKSFLFVCAFKKPFFSKHIPRNDWYMLIHQFLLILLLIIVQYT